MMEYFDEMNVGTSLSCASNCCVKLEHEGSYQSDDGLMLLRGATFEPH